MKANIPTTNGVSIRKALIYMIAFILAVSVLLLITTGSVSSRYASLNVNMESYKQWQRDASSLQTGSDYLTEQVRSFVITGDRAYLDSYFEEANVTRRRDHAIESARRLMGETEAYTSLVSAMDESVDLMNREYYAMRLAIAGYGLDAASFPQELQAVALTDRDLADSPEAQRETARLMLYDEAYRSKKQAITGSVQACLDALDAEIEASQTRIQQGMQRTILQQRIMIGATILAMIAITLMFMRMVVGPLLKAVTYIRRDQELPVEGAAEFRFLVREYNAAHRSNADQKQELAFEATHDNLTGVYNRNGYDSIRQSVDWSTSALVLFDLDQFKSVNDKFGHAMGDRVLARTAKTIQNAFRAKDFVCRIGGDEFAVIMVSITTQSGQVIRDKVRRINEELGRPADGMPGIHISSGAAFGALIPDFDTLFHEADAALYRIKNQGVGDCEVVQ